jgi:response regulator RpfG family c-di-GMP phosphodiesterase
MSISILCVDDDPNVLEGYRRLLGRRYNVYLACGALQGLDKLDMGPYYSVIISDKRMPDMDGVEFLSRASKRFPASVRVMLTGDADQQATMDAMNKGNIQRFLLKPCPSRLLEQVVDEAVALSRQQLQSLDLCQARRAAERQLAQTLTWARPEASERGQRALQRAQGLAQARGMELPEAAEVALRLAEIGALAVPQDAWRKQAAGRILNPAEKAALAQQPILGAGMLGAMPGWEEAAELSLQMHGSHEPSLLGGLLKLALDLERALEAHPVFGEALVLVRPQHLNSPWLALLEGSLTGAQEAENSKGGMAYAA